MSKLDVDIYMNNIIKFFDNNPNDLKTLIGDLDKKLFYDKVREQAVKNDNGGEGIELTQRQFADIIAKMFGKDKKGKETEENVNLFFKTKYGSFCMN